MKRVDGKKFLIGILFVGLLVLSLSLVAAQQQGVLKTLWDTFFKGIFDNVGFTISEDMILQIAQVLMTLLVTMVIYSVSDFIPFLGEKESIKWAVSVIVAVLAFLMIDTETIKGILTTYNALGVALVSIIPLIILVAFSFKISTHPNPSWRVVAKFLNPFLFCLFSLWLILQWYNTDMIGPGKTYTSMYLGSALVALVFAFFSSRLWRYLNKKLQKEHFEAGVEKSETDQINRMRAKIDDLKQTAANASKSERVKMNARIRELEENIAELMRKSR